MKCVPDSSSKCDFQISHLHFIWHTALVGISHVSLRFHTADAAGNLKLTWKIPDSVLENQLKKRTTYFYICTRWHCKTSNTRWGGNFHVWLILFTVLNDKMLNEYRKFFFPHLWTTCKLELTTRFSETNRIFTSNSLSVRRKHYLAGKNCVNDVKLGWSCVTPG